MSDIIFVSRFPSPARLAWFFRTRPTLTTEEAGYFLGWEEAQVRNRAEEAGALLPGDRVRFDDVAFWLLDAWPRRRLLDALGPAADLLPDGLHLMPVSWELPRYLVRAITRQAALQLTPDEAEHELTVQDYIARLLHLAIEPNTVAALAADPEFTTAFDYPDAGERSEPQR
jgi:hypothetical protein